MKSVTLGQIASLLNVQAPPDAEAVSISGINVLADATATELSFLSGDRHRKEFQKTRAAAVLVRQGVRLDNDGGRRVLVVPDADLAVARLLPLFAPPIARPPEGVDPAARIDPSAALGAGCAVGPFVVVGADASIGAGCILHGGVHIGQGVTLGDGCELFVNVVVRERVTIGRRVTIHAGSVLGTDGFGYRWNGQAHEKIPQIGTVVIEDDVEIGSCVCIDRAKFAATRIGRGSKIDNLVQIGHNVVVGPHCVIVGQTGIAGSAHLGAGVVLGGQTAVRDHVTIGDGAMAAACAAIVDDLDPKAIVSGMPALPHRQTLREQAALRRLPELVVQVRKLQEQLAALAPNQTKDDPAQQSGE